MGTDTLRLRIIEDHHHLDQLFESTSAALERLDQTDVASEDLEEISADLTFALEEMLEHFSVEEEAVFAFIKDALPHLNDRIAELEEAHEVLCAKMRELRIALVNTPTRGVSRVDLSSAMALADVLARSLKAHNQSETRIFLEALERLDEEGRKTLLEALNTH